MTSKRDDTAEFSYVSTPDTQNVVYTCYQQRYLLCLVLLTKERSRRRIFKKLLIFASLIMDLYASYPQCLKFGLWKAENARFYFFFSFDLSDSIRFSER